MHKSNVISSPITFVECYVKNKILSGHSCTVMKSMLYMQDSWELWHFGWHGQQTLLISG